MLQGFFHHIIKQLVISYSVLTNKSNSYQIWRNIALITNVFKKLDQEDTKLYVIPVDI